MTQTDTAEHMRTVKYPAARALLGASVLCLVAMSPLGCQGPRNSLGGPGSVEAQDTQPPGVSAPDEGEILISPTDDSVVLAFADYTWGSPWPPTEFLSTGEKSRVDTRLGERISVTKEDGGDARLVLGEGLWAPDYRGNALAPGHGANFYQDEKGIRLIALEGEHFGSDMIILSQESRHPARLVHIDFSSLRTESGIGLRDRRDRVLKALGEASHLDAFGQYQLLWYLGEVEADKYGGRFACAAAYVLKEDRVVEIWLYVWSPDPSG